MLTKEQEIAMLKKFVAKANEEPHSYLASLFTPELVKWFERQVSNDESCNLIEDVVYYREHHAQEIQSCLAWQAQFESEKRNRELERQAAQDDKAAMEQRIDETVNETTALIQSLREVLSSADQLAAKQENFIEQLQALVVGEFMRGNDTIALARLLDEFRAFNRRPTE
jgi:hypothetical protein